MSRIGILLAAGFALAVSTTARADDFDALMQQANRGKPVDVLVTSWQPVTGEINPEDLGSVVTGAIDVQAEHRTLMRRIAAAGGQATVLRDYKYLRVSSLRVDARALQAAKSLGNTHIYHDEFKSISLADSVSMTGAPAFWQAGQRADGQMVAVLDTGVDRDHPFLAGKVVHEACFSVRSCPNGGNKMLGEGAAKPVHTHGTHVAGIIAGENENFSGVAPGAKIIGVNVFSRDGDRMGARDRDILAGLDYVLSLMIDQKLPIAAINMSLGGGEYSAKPCHASIYEKAAQISLQLGTVMVVAAGNEGNKTGLPSPACAESAVSVGAIDKGNKVAKFSNSAAYLDILAPGVKILSSASAPGRQGYLELDGTSMAAPHVAGAMALLRASDPDMDAAVLVDRLKSTDSSTDPANNLKTQRLKISAPATAPERSRRRSPQPPKQDAPPVAETDPPKKQRPPRQEEPQEPPVAETEQPPEQPDSAPEPEPEKQKPPRRTGVISIGGDDAADDGAAPIGGDTGTTAIIQ